MPSRRGSVTILPGEGRRNSLISTQSPPAITATHAYASLISSDNKLRKSTTGKLSPDHAVSTFEQKERRRSRAFFESDRRKESISPHKRDKRETPAMITLRKASIHYKCGGFGTISPRGRSRQATVVPDRLQGGNEALPHTPDSGSRSSRSSMRHRLMETSPVGHRTGPTDPALTVTDTFANLPDSEAALGDTKRDSASIVEAKRKCSTTRVQSRSGSQEIIWKKDGSPSSWSNNHSSIGSPISSHDSEDGGVPLPPTQFPSHISAVLPTLTEEHHLDPGVGPSNQRLAILGDASGGWPWDVGISPAYSGVEIQTIYENSPKHQTSSPEPLHVPKTRRTTSNDAKKDQGAEHHDQADSKTRSVSFPLVMPEIDINLDQLESDFQDESKKATIYQFERALNNAATETNDEKIKQDAKEVSSIVHSQASGQQQLSNHGFGMSSAPRPTEAPGVSILPPTIRVHEGTASGSHGDTNATDNSQPREYVLNTPLTSFNFRKGPARTYDGANDEEDDHDSVSTPTQSPQAKRSPAPTDLKGGMAKSLLTSLLVKEMVPVPVAKELKELSSEAQAEINDYRKDQIPERHKLLGHRSITTGPRPGGSLDRKFSLRAKTTVLDNGKVEVVASSSKTSPKKSCQKRSLSEAEVSSRKKREGSDKSNSPKERNVRFLLTPGM